MAELIRRRARKPIIADGNVWTGSNIRWAQSARKGWVQASDFKYTLTVIGKNDEERDREYAAHLSESEMLSTVAAWLEAHRNMRLRDLDRESETSDKLAKAEAALKDAGYELVGDEWQSLNR